MRITRWAAGAALGVAAGALALAVPASAQDGHFPAGGWQVRDIGLGETDWRAGTAASSSISSSTVELTKPAGDVGTSAETPDVGLEVAAGDTISVAYELVDGATPDAGAVRLFWYSSPDADTLGAAPTGSAIADATSGTLSITVADAAKVGTLGLVYDASNAATGTARFTNLEVAGTPILFAAPDPDPSPSATPGPDPTGKPTPGPAPSDPAAPGQGGGDDKPGLPVTGAPAALIAAGGAGLLVLGGGVYLLARRRRVSFTA